MTEKREKAGKKRSDGSSLNCVKVSDEQMDTGPENDERYAQGEPEEGAKLHEKGENPHAGHRARMRERFQREKGFDSFSDVQILEMLLFYGNSRSDTHPMAEKLLETFGSLKGVLEAGTDQLKSVKGIGDRQATLISMVVPLTRVWLKCAGDNDKKARILTRTDLENYCRSMLIGKRTEQFYVICVDAQSRVIGQRRISEGSLSEVSAYPRLVLETALNYNAHSVFFCHNHPGGTCAPSTEDISSTLQLQRLLAGVGIPVYDHLIVADDKTYSMSQHGDINFRTGVAAR